MIRQPVVVGSFYHGSKSGLEKEMKRLIDVSPSKKKVKGMLVPHAGHVISGDCAGRAYGAIEIPNSIIILGVNHHGQGKPFAVVDKEAWHTPLGDISLDTDLMEKLLTDSKVFEKDSDAAPQDHSIEVQLPFIQYLNPGAKILPVYVSSMDKEKLKDGGLEIANLIKENPDVLIVVSSDMSHNLSAEMAQKKDNMAIAKINDVDAEGLYDIVLSERLSMCGASSAVMMLTAARELGARNTEVMNYTNSGRVTGMYYQVVSYLSMLVY
jgi:AmmeMemoRadiSam system protein B